MGRSVFGSSFCSPLSACAWLGRLLWLFVLWLLNSQLVPASFFGLFQSWDTVWACRCGQICSPACLARSVGRVCASCLFVHAFYCTADSSMLAARLGFSFLGGSASLSAPFACAWFFSFGLSTPACAVCTVFASTAFRTFHPCDSGLSVLFLVAHPFLPSLVFPVFGWHLFLCSILWAFFYAVGQFFSLSRSPACRVFFCCASLGPVLQNWGSRFSVVPGFGYALVFGLCFCPLRLGTPRSYAGRMLLGLV